MARVLVTGGSGFIGAHCIIRLLTDGHEVRTTVRDPARADDVHAMVRRGGAIGADERLTVAAADLTADAGWTEAVADCDHVLHVASPYPDTAPDHEDELIVPARDGALRVLRAARDAGVHRVVLTSSFAAVGYGLADRADPSTEEDWTNLDGPGVQAYQKSKTLAERAAWDFIEREGGDLELTAVNPVGVMGPVLGTDYSTSIRLVKQLLDRTVPGCPHVWFGIVDVRDVADLHVRAMTDPAAPGERFLATSGDFLAVGEIARILKHEAGKAGRRVPTLALPNWAVRAAALLDPSIRQLLPELGKHKNATAQKAHRLLGWTPRSPEAALIATAHSLHDLGLLKR
jgi:nucleoside-diphosphate-sugar epimerase